MVDAVGGRATVVVDGGIVRGTDIAKARALGADLVGIGRLLCCGLAAGGTAGVVRVLELLEEECRIDLGLLGVHRFDQLDGRYLARAEPVMEPGMWSQFPLVGAAARE